MTSTSGLSSKLPLPGEQRRRFEDLHPERTDQSRETISQTEASSALRTLVGGNGAGAARVLYSGRLVTQFGEVTDGSATCQSRRDALLCETWGPVDPARLDALTVLLSRVLDTSLVHDELVTALVESQNQVLSLYAIGQIRASSTDRVDVEERLIHELARLTRSEAVTLLADGEDKLWGATGPAEWLHEAVTGQSWIPGGEAVHLRGDLYTGIIWPLPARHGEPAAMALARSDSFRTTDFKLMRFVGEIIASARDTAFFQAEAVSRAGIEQEHQMASRLAQALLPAHPPVLKGCEVAERTVPALSAGGDFYTHSVIDDVLFFAVGDVAGKGLPAALVMTKVIAACAASFSRHAPERVDAIVAELCDELYPYLSEIGLFATILVGSYAPASGVLHLYNAGHSPTMIVRADGIQLIPPTMPPLGVLPDPIGTSHTIQLLTGDLLVAGSDGLTEQEDPAGVLFGYDRFNAEVSGMHSRSVGEVSDHIFQLVAEHGAGVNASDDQTLFVLRHGVCEPNDAAADPAADAFLTIPASHLGARDIGPWLAALCAGRPGGGECLSRLELALHELCINIVDHAYLGQEGEIRIAGWLSDAGIRLEIRDRGTEFVQEMVATPEPGVPQIRGYGLFLIEKLIDSSHYLRQQDENVWTMTIGWGPLP
jgi:serine phosphatase RsbU (regulator of sigma subunit)